LLALRTLLLNLFFRAAKGEAIPEPEMAGADRAGRWREDATCA